MKKLFYFIFGQKRDIVWGLINALVISVPVYLINMGEFGQYAAVGKQAVYAFFIGSHMVRIGRHVSRWVINHRHLSDKLAIWFGIVIAFTINTGLNILLHSLKGTPDPRMTIFVVATLSLVGLILVGYIETSKIRNQKKRDSQHRFTRKKI